MRPGTILINLQSCSIHAVHREEFQFQLPNVSSTNDPIADDYNV